MTTKNIEEVVKLINKVRFGAMDEKQFKATVEYNICNLLDTLFQNIHRTI